MIRITNLLSFSLLIRAALWRTEKGWGDDDPLFPATEVAGGPDQRFVLIGLARMHWSGTASIRRIFNDAFAGAGVPYANPHSFRSTFMQLAYDCKLSHEEMKAWRRQAERKKRPEPKLGREAR